MKILYIVSSLRRSGPIIVLQNIIRNITTSIDGIYIIKLCKDEPERSITHEFVNDGIKIIECDFSKLQLELYTNYCTNIVRRKIKEISPDIIHVHGYQPALVGSKLKLKIPVTITFHCITEEDFISSKGKFIGKFMVWRFKRALKYFDRGVAISQNVKEYHQLLTSNSLPIDLVYNGINFAYKAFDAVEVRQKYAIKPSDTVFVVVGSLSTRKDPLCVIKAFKVAFKEIADVKLLFLGKGVLLNECIKEKGSDSRITMVGWTPKVSSFLEVADYSISASHSEGFGLNVIESLSCGTPVILTDIPVFDEFRALYPILKSYTFKCGNYRELAEIMRKAYESKRSIAPTVYDVNERFSSKKMGLEYLKHYNLLLSANK